jgi:catechol 2,3-dioxygenase-like lactoylglutathione lyase family enzyme
MIRPRRIGHAVFETPDLERKLAYYTETIGLAPVARERDRAFLATKLGQLVVELRRSGVARCVKLTFEVAAGADFAGMARTLAAEGIKSEIRSDPAPGVSNVLAFDDPKGTTIELFSEWSYAAPNQDVVGAAPLKLGHVAFWVPDVKAVAEFYERVLGFRVSDWIGNFFVFMRCNADHHTVNFITGKEAGIHHMAFEVKDFSHLQNACDVLGRRNVPIAWGPARLGPGHNIAVFHRNPDDQLIELYCELDQMKDEALGYFDPRPWHRDRPQRPKVWEGETARMIWGLPPGADFLRRE